MKMVMLGYFIILSIWDIRERQIPQYMLVAGTAIASVILGINVFVVGDVFWKMLTAFCGIIPGVGAMVLAKVSGKIGMGDGWVLLIVGLVSDYKICIAVLGVSMLLMASYSIIMLIVRRVTRDTMLPYLPFLTAAWLFMAVM